MNIEGEKVTTGNKVKLVMCTCGTIAKETPRDPKFDAICSPGLHEERFYCTQCHEFIRLTVMD